MGRPRPAAGGRRGPRGSGWTPERIERASRMWLSGASAAAIGKALGVSRDAVLGKLGRLGVCRSEQVNSANRVTGKGTKTAEAPEPVARPAPTPARWRRQASEPQPTSDLAGLQPHMCRWPIGEPDEAGFGFCGRPSARGVYCEAHRRRAYRPGPLEPIERVAGLRPERERDGRRPKVFERWVVRR